MCMCVCTSFLWWGLVWWDVISCLSSTNTMDFPGLSCGHEDLGRYPRLCASSWAAPRPHLQPAGPSHVVSHGFEYGLREEGMVDPSHSSLDRGRETFSGPSFRGWEVQRIRARTLVLGWHVEGDAGTQQGNVGDRASWCLSASFPRALLVNRDVCAPWFAGNGWQMTIMKQYFRDS